MKAGSSKGVIRNKLQKKVKPLRDLDSKKCNVSLIKKMMKATIDEDDPYYDIGEYNQDNFYETDCFFKRIK